MKYIPPYKCQQSSSIRANDERVGAAANEKLAPVLTGLAVQGFQYCSREKYFSLLNFALRGLRGDAKNSTKYLSIFTKYLGKSHLIIWGVGYFAKNI